MKITVVALGKIGLPLAVQFAIKGNTVFGTDVNEKTVNKVNSAVEPFPGEKDLGKKLKQVIESGHLIASTNTRDAVSKSEVVVIVVPLFVDSEGTPDFTLMDSATVEVSQGLKPGTLVTYETTLPVGTTRNRFAAMLEEYSGLKAGSDFYLAFSPERVFTGRVFEDLRKYPKLVGGINLESGKKAEDFYRSVLDFDDRDDLHKKNGVWNLGSSEASELAKLAETTYRDVNIGLANQFAKFASRNSINIYEVIEACNSQHFSHIHQPGISVGGHCIPVYPQMYLWNDEDATIVSAARTVNKNMPMYFVDELEQLHGDLRDQTVVILGISYRPNVKEIAFSGAFDLISSLQNKKSRVLVHDPLYSKSELEELAFDSFNFNEKIDALILHTGHQDYAELTSSDFFGLKTVLDGRNILNPKNFQGLNFKSFAAKK